MTRILPGVLLAALAILGAGCAGSPSAQYAVLGLVPHGALLDYARSSGRPPCLLAIGVGSSAPGEQGASALVPWRETERAANAAARKLSGNTRTWGIRLPGTVDIVVQEGPGPPVPPLERGEVVVLRPDGKMAIRSVEASAGDARLTPVDLTASWVRGPIEGDSAGLALGLSAYDAFSYGPLCAVSVVAATGTIDDHGNVGRVGMVADKAAAAEQFGADLLLVPPGQGSEARGSLQGQDMLVIEVRTLAEAVAAVREQEAALAE